MSTTPFHPLLNPFLFLCLSLNILFSSCQVQSAKPPVQLTKGEKFDGELQQFIANGKSLTDDKQYASAMLEFEKAVLLDPSYADTYEARGYARVAMKDMQGARDDFNKLVELRPYKATSYNTRAMFRMEIGLYKGAYTDMTKALEIQPNQIEYYTTRAYVSFVQKNYDLAMVDIETAITRNPENAAAYYYRARIELAMGQEGKACEDYRKAKRMNAAVNDDELKVACK